MKKRYVKDYKFGSDAKHFHYVGAYYVHGLDKRMRQKSGGVQLLAAAVEILLLVGVGFLNSPGTYTMYVIVPMLCMFFPILYYMMGTWNFMHCESRMERYQYDSSFLRMTKCAAAGLFLNLFALLGDVLLIVRNAKAWEEYSEYLLLTALVIMGVMNYTALAWHRYLMKQVRQEETQ